MAVPQPPFYIQIADANGVVIRTRSGGRHEAELISHFMEYLLPYGLSLFKTKGAATKAIKEALMALKVRDPSDVKDTAEP
jgi:hypothetical protein